MAECSSHEAIARREVVGHGTRVVDSLPWGCPPTRVAAIAGTASGLWAFPRCMCRERSMHLAALQTPRTPALQARVLARQRRLHAQFRQVDPAGQLMAYRDTQFVVSPTVFWPSDDSKPLVQHWEIMPGERVLDLCTGSGVIAVMAAYAGARTVLALDKHPAAVHAATKHAELHRCAGVIEVRESDLFAAVAPGETFEVMTMHPPYTPHLASDHVEASTWEGHFALHQRFFADVQQFLTPGGRIYLGQASFGPLARVQAFATQAGFAIRLIGSTHVETELPRTSYAFQRTPRRSGRI